RNYNYGTAIDAEYREADGYYGNFLMTPETCQQGGECGNEEGLPACAAACPVDAINVHENMGSWMVDKGTCIGCGDCVEACPWTMPTLDPVENKSTKCILCGLCAENCITGALKSMPWEEVSEAARRKGFIFA